MQIMTDYQIKYYLDITAILEDKDLQNWTKILFLNFFTIIVVAL